MIKGYWMDKNFFTGEPQEELVRFFLCDGGCTAEYSPIMRIKDVIISIDFDTQKAIVNIPNAYGKGIFGVFMREINLTSERDDFVTFCKDIQEWLGYTEKWRKVGRDYKKCTFIFIENGEIKSMKVYQGISQEE